MTNANCLEGIRCPACGNEDRFRIAATSIFTVTDDGTGDHGDVEWHDGSFTECAGCSRSGILKDFRAAAKAAEADAAGHTPAPWAYEEETGRVYFADGEVEPTIAFLDLENTSPVRAKADGHLIVAAPTLLAACRMVVERWERGDLAEAARACQAAVTLATDGRPPCGIATSMPKPYSVLLLYPDYANDDGTETYYTWVQATDPVAAVAEAQREAMASNEWGEEDCDPGDFVPLLVTEGGHYGLPMSND